MADKIHPATTITNIKSAIPLTLDYESAKYNNWKTLFTIHAKATLTYEHIVPPPVDDTATTPASPLKTEAEKAHWDRIDNIVRQWIYGTISEDLLNTIIAPDDTAADAWNRLAELFQDNKISRAIHLETEFATINLRDFPDAKAFTRHLKVLADQLANVGAKVSDQRMVLRLLTGLTEAYDGFVTVVQNMKPLPTFAQARSMLLLDETTKAELAKLETGSTSVFLMNSNTDNLKNNGQQQETGQNRNSNNKGRKNNVKYRGGNNHRNQQTRGGRGGDNRNQQRPPQQQQQAWNFPAWGGWVPQPWATPPCPYPTAPWGVRPPMAARQQGILGARPPQSFYTATPAPSVYAPTDIDHAMHTLSLNQPDDNWYMDTGATSHMTTNPGPTDGEQTTET